MQLRFLSEIRLSKSYAYSVILRAQRLKYDILCQLGMDNSQEAFYAVFTPTHALTTHDCTFSVLLTHSQHLIERFQSYSHTQNT
jgi:hypothetical protein